jgi:hypothetical protein
MEPTPEPTPRSPSTSMVSADSTARRPVGWSSPSSAGWRGSTPPRCSPTSRGAPARSRTSGTYWRGPSRSATATVRPNASRRRQANYLHPGHNVHIDEDSEFVEFTQANGAPGNQHDRCVTESSHSRRRSSRRSEPCGVADDCHRPGHEELISLVSTHGKTPDQVAAELIATIRRYQEATNPADGDPEAPTSSADPEAVDRSDRSAAGTRLVCMVCAWRGSTSPCPTSCSGRHERLS